MRIKRGIKLAVLALFIFSSAGMSATLNKTTILGKPYYVYKVKKGDTMFGLSRQFGWDVNVLTATNPSEMTSLSKNAIIYYPCDNEADKAKPDATSDAGDKDSQCIRHKIMRGETLSSISRMYNVPLDQLYKLNPGCREGIKADEWLVISKNEVRKDDKGNYHTIQQGETIYGVARENGISVESLLEANPGISEKKFRTGEVIRIPAKGTGIKVSRQTVTENTIKGFRTYRVKKNETWKSIGEKFNVDPQVLRDANPGVKLKNKVYIGVPVVSEDVVERDVVVTDPREENTKGIQDIYNDVHGIADETASHVRMAVVVDNPTSTKDRQFLRGVLLAVNNLKNSGTKIDLKVIDSNGSTEANIQNLNTFKPTIVISTAERSLPSWLVNYAQDESVYVTNTLVVKDKAYQTNPYILQLMTPPEYFNDEIAAWLKNRYDGYSLVFTGEKDNDDSLAESLSAIWDPAKVRSRSIDDLRTLPLNEQGKYLLYTYPVRKAEVSSFIDAVTEAKNKSPLATVSIVGRPNWIVFDETLGDKFHENDVMIPARFYMNKNDRTGSVFAMNYRQMFDALVDNSFPVYSAMGYDVANYFITGLSAAGGDMNMLGASSDTLQSDFNLKRTSNWSGLLNTAVYMVRFTPYDTIEKTIVK